MCAWSRTQTTFSFLHRFISRLGHCFPGYISGGVILVLSFWVVPTSTCVVLTELELKSLRGFVVLIRLDSQPHIRLLIYADPMHSGNCRRRLAPTNSPAFIPVHPSRGAVRGMPFRLSTDRIQLIRRDSPFSLFGLRVGNNFSNDTRRKKK